MLPVGAGEGSMLHVFALIASLTVLDAPWIKAG